MSVFSFTIFLKPFCAYMLEIFWTLLKVKTGDKFYALNITHFDSNWLHNLWNVGHFSNPTHHCKHCIISLFVKRINKIIIYHKVFSNLFKKGLFNPFTVQWL